MIKPYAGPVVVRCFLPGCNENLRALDKISLSSLTGDHWQQNSSRSKMFGK
jgi:hypothetical protein